MNGDTFNLVEKPWIPILRRNGRAERVGIRTALAEAGSIRQIAASNPMDNVALLRFLLAVLLWCKEDAKSALAMLGDNSKGVPEDWFATLEKHQDAFNLLGDGRRFYQDNSVEDNARPVGDLLVEFPTETKIAHFSHVQDKRYGLCPACCALGIVRFCAFANAYGGGRYTSAVNGPTPAYVLEQGATLLETLRLILPQGIGSRRDPPWLMDDPPKNGTLNFPTVFAWRSRRLWLGDPGADGSCAYCGSRERLIHQIAFTGNWKPPFETSGTQKKFWDEDPHLILVDKTAGDDDDELAGTEETRGTEQSVTRKGRTKSPVKTTLGFPSPGAKTAAHARFWRRVVMAKCAAQSGKSAEPATMMVAGPAANKGLYQDAASMRLPVPGGDAAPMLEAQSKAVEGVTGVLRRSTPNPDRQHPNRVAALDALSASLESELRRDVARDSGRGTPDAFKDALNDRLTPIVGQVVRSTTSGSPLRRREALARARSALDHALKKATAAQNAAPAEQKPADADGPRPAKPKRTRKKKGAAS